MNKLYLAYGSNLNRKQMESRCPKATFEGTTELENYKIVYRFNNRNRAVMSIEKYEGIKIPVGIYSITETDEKELDKYEGVKSSVYRKEILQVEFKGKKVNVLTYIMNEEGHPYAELNRNIKESNEYYERIEKGYKDCGFDPKYLKEITELHNKNIKKIIERKQ